MVPKGRKKGAGNGTEPEAVPVVRVKPCPSFFRFFAPAVKSRRRDPSALHDNSDVRIERPHGPCPPLS